MTACNSVTAVNTFENCPYQFKLRYLDQLEVIPDPWADDALIVGNALHLGAEKDELAMLDFYFSQYRVINDLHIHQAIKLTALLKKLKSYLNHLSGSFRHEYKIERPEFIGFVDLIVTNSDGTVDVYDFKHSNNVEYYLKSKQLHLYKFYLEREGFKVNRLGYIFIPKTGIYQGKKEEFHRFRRRLLETLSGMEIRVEYVDYDFQKVKEFWESIEAIKETEEFPKKPTKLCRFCSFKRLCEEGIDFDVILPSSERRQIDAITKKVLWLYGPPFSGKTYFANQFPKPLMLNTDGNIRFVDSPYVAIRNEVTMDGRITNTKLAWLVFKDVIAELEKRQNDFETIIVDLLEDCYEHCRLYIYDKEKIEHESDNSYKYWDMVKTEFLSTLKRLINLDYNIILISHEDTSKDITKRTGDKITRIAPNIQEKSANKIAGMVDIVARVVNEDDDRFLTFKTSEVEFGGGRLTLATRKIPLDYEAFLKIYDTAQSAGAKSKRERSPKEVAATENPVAAENSIQEDVSIDKDTAETEQPKRTRRIRG